MYWPHEPPWRPFAALSAANRSAIAERVLPALAQSITTAGRRGLDRGRLCRRGRRFSVVARQFRSRVIGGVGVQPLFRRPCHRTETLAAAPPSPRLRNPDPDGLTATLCSGGKTGAAKLPVSSAVSSADASVRGLFGAYCGGNCGGRGGAQDRMDSARLFVILHGTMEVDSKMAVSLQHWRQRNALTQVDRKSVV